MYLISIGRHNVNIELAKFSSMSNTFVTFQNVSWDVIYLF